MRNFSTQFLALCQHLKIDILFLEAVLISSIIATFNDLVFSNWQYHMRTNRASLGNIREFLAAQEEMATDEWMQGGSLALNEAIRSAQPMISDPLLPAMSIPDVTVPENVQIESPSYQNRQQSRNPRKQIHSKRTMIEMALRRVPTAVKRQVVAIGQAVLDPKPQRHHCQVQSVRENRGERTGKGEKSSDKKKSDKKGKE